MENLHNEYNKAKIIVNFNDLREKVNVPWGKNMEMGFENLGMESTSCSSYYMLGLVLVQRAQP